MNRNGFTYKQITEGPDLVRGMSQKAQEEYYGSDCYGLYTDMFNPEMCYFRVCGDAPKHMTIKEVEECLEEFADDDWLKEEEEEEE